MADDCRPSGSRTREQRSQALTQVLYAMEPDSSATASSASRCCWLAVPCAMFPTFEVVWTLSDRQLPMLDPHAITRDKAPVVSRDAARFEPFGAVKGSSRV